MTNSQQRAALRIPASGGGGEFRKLQRLTLLLLLSLFVSSALHANDVCVPFEKQVSIDGGLNWYDADTPGSAPTLPPGGDSEYRFVLNNCETTKVCLDTRVRDDILGIEDPGNPSGVLVAAVIAPQEQVIVTKATPGFENLDQPGRCIPMNSAKETTLVEGSSVPEMFIDDAYVNCAPPPSIDIEKATNGVDADDPNAGDAPQIAAGDPVTWSYLVTNTGSVALGNVAVFDDRIGSVVCPRNALGAGESMLCNAMGTAEDLQLPGAETVPGVCGSIPQRPLYANMGSVTGTYLATGEMVMDEDPSHYCNPEEPAIDIEKATNGVDADDPNAGDAPQIAAGDGVTWSYLVTNTGTVPLINVQAFDETLGNSLICPKDTLAPGEGMTCDDIVGMAADLVIGDANVVDGTCGGMPGKPLYENISRVSGESPTGMPVQDFDPSHYCNPPPPPECGLSVQKFCEIPAPPPAPGGKCEGKLQQFSMIWDGADGAAISGPDNDAPGGVVNNGDKVTFFGPFSDNNVPVDIAGLGTSIFHVSCSDKDMDGDSATNEDQSQVSPVGRDCGKFQGDGKGASGVNQWLLDGFVDKVGDELICTAPPAGAPTSNCEFVSTPVDCDTAGKPEVITMRYIGGVCPGSNTQGGKSNCSGTVDGTESVSVTLDGGMIGPIAPGATFDVPTTGSNTVIILSNSGGTQLNEVHTSCSAPLVAGETFGALALLALDGQGPGANVTYSYLIANNGTETVNGISAIDDVLGPVPGTPIEMLAPGESTMLSATALVNESVTNTVTVNGSTASGAICLTSASATVTALGPPPCDVSIVLDKIEDKKFKVKLVNNSASRSATIESISVSWPGSEDLKKVKFDGSEIFKEHRAAPSTTILEDEWQKAVKDRVLKPDDDQKLEIEFEDDFPLGKHQPLSDFELTITFKEGCSVTL